MQPDGAARFGDRAVAGVLDPDQHISPAGQLGAQLDICTKIYKIGDTGRQRIASVSDASSGRVFSARDVTIAQRLSAIACPLIRKQWQVLRSSGTYDRDSLVLDLRRTLAATHGICLSPRQSEVALLILRGHSSVSIGLRLDISAQTVKVFRKQLNRKCRISSQAELFSLVMLLLPERSATADFQIGAQPRAAAFEK